MGNEKSKNLKEPLLLTEVAWDKDKTNEDEVKSQQTINSIPILKRLKPPKPPKPPIALVLVRICAISVILSIGFAINFVSILRAIANKEQSANIWAIIYVASSIWLFISCIIMIIITLFGFKIKLFLVHHCKIAICLFVVGICGYITSLTLGLLLEKNNKYICLQFELLYSLQSLYLMCLIYFFNHKHFTQIINLILFSITLFVTPFISLLLTINSIQSKPYLFASYVSVCISTSILILIHIICLLKHYNSGLFLKSLIISSLSYYMIVHIKGRIDFDKYTDTYRIYYYYVLLSTLCVMYCCELSVQGSKRIIRIDAKSLAESPSFDFQIVTMEDRMHALEAENKNKNICGILTLMNRKPISLPPNPNDINYTNPNEKIESVIQIFPDFKPAAENNNKYFNQFIINDKKHSNIDRFTDSIAAIVPFYNEKAHEIHATLRSLYFNFEYIKRKQTKYKFTHFNVLLVGDGWFKADISTKRYLAKLYNGCTEFDDDFACFKQKKHKHNTVILQTKFNKRLCINPFKNDEKKLFLKVTTIIKIDNRKKANSHEWFLGRYGFAEWCKCDYMFFTDAYSTLNKEGLYEMVMHMKQPKNQDVVCCTGRARVYTIEQELDLQNLLREKHVNKKIDVDDTDDIDDTKSIDEDDNKYNLEEKENKFVKWWENDIFASSSDDNKVDIMADNDGIDDGDNVFYNIQDMDSDHRLTMNAHLRSCQMFEFEAIYGTIGCYLLGGFLPVIPGPCGFYRSSYLLPDEVRGWYFEKINKKNDPQNIDLVLGNMKLAEDRILTISSILNSSFPVRHTLIPECVFYFDPQPSLSQLMKQRRRWINGSVATVLFVLRKISFSRWKVNIFRRYYVLSLWYMQLFMFVVVALSPPLIFTISFTYGLATILDVVLSGNKDTEIRIIVILFMVLSWFMYITFIYFVQGQTRIKIIKKETIVQLTLVISFVFGLLTLSGTLVQLFDVVKYEKSILEPTDNSYIVTTSFNFAVILIEVTFFLQSFILAPLVSKDIKTLIILIKTCFFYFLYSPFYVSFFFINAMANVHDLSWGTRPDNIEENKAESNNPKQTTIKLLLVVIFMDVIIGCVVHPFTEYIYAHIIFFSVLAFPSVYQILFSLLWLIKTRLFTDLLPSCRPKKLIDEIEYINLIK